MVKSWQDIKVRHIQLKDQEVGKCRHCCPYEVVSFSPLTHNRLHSLIHSLVHSPPLTPTGWFDTPCSDFADSSWRHWAHFRGPAPNGTWYQFEMWPDMSEFEDDELCPTGFTYEDGSSAGLFSSYNSKTVDRHVKWMKDYDVDGVFVQRFITRFQRNPRERCFVDRVLDNVRRGSERHGRVFANMYDISGAKDETIYETIKQDWMYLVDVQEITKSSSYLHHKGRPLVSIWGLGTTNRPGEAAGAIQLLQWFHHAAEPKYRATVKGGVPNGWQDNSRDTKPGYGWYQAFRRFDVISPWSVGRFRGMSGVDYFTNQVTVPNARECQVLGIDYMPVVWPGFSWAYKNIRNPERDEPFNKYARQAGKFFWRQIQRAVSAFPTGMPKQVYVAMFDEVDEATAIFKIAESPEKLPKEGQFLTMEMDGYGVTNDWYLRLMGAATLFLRGDGSVPEEMPLTASQVPTPMPTPEPTALPSIAPTDLPSVSPTTNPTALPTGTPTESPNSKPSSAAAAAASFSNSVFTTSLVLAVVFGGIANVIGL